MDGDGTDFADGTVFEKAVDGVFCDCNCGCDGNDGDVVLWCTDSPAKYAAAIAANAATIATLLFVLAARMVSRN